MIEILEGFVLVLCCLLGFVTLAYHAIISCEDSHSEKDKDYDNFL